MIFFFFQIAFVKERKKKKKSQLNITLENSAGRNCPISLSAKFAFISATQNVAVLHAQNNLIPTHHQPLYTQF